MRARPANADCPGEEEIAAFVRGGLAAQRVVAMELHVSECAECRRLLSALALTIVHESRAADSVSPTLPIDAGAPGAELPIGARIGRYIVLDWLGAGGMGVVYAAYDPELNRKVALKVLRSDGEPPTDRSAIRDLLVREAQAMARLAHPNVVAVHDVGSADDRVFIAMELVEGMTLARWLAAERRPQREILDVLLAAGHGLAAAHEAGLIHRDFKPDNVLIGDDGRVRVTDFGLARAAPREIPGAAHAAVESRRREPAHTGLVGTLAYMAPEQYLGRAVDARADQFSFAVALYEGLYGERPFAALERAEPDDAVERRVRTPPPASGVPAGLRDVLLRALRSAPDERYPSMAALLTALSPAPRPRRGKLVAAGAIATLAIAVVAGGGYTIELQRAAARRTELVGRLRAMAPEIRTQLQSAHLLPLHDIRPAREQVRVAIRELERQRQTPAGEDAAALVDFVLGEGYLALGEHDRALALLEAAWQGGERGPDIDAALGYTLGAVYQHRLVQIEETVPTNRRDAEVHAIEQRYRDPAMTHLRGALSGTARPPAYLEALIAFHDHRYAESSDSAHAVFAAQPTFYDAGVLEAKARNEVGRQLLRANRRSDASAAFAAARQVFARVLEIARSDDQAWLDDGELLYHQALALAQGELPAELQHEAAAALRTARQINPDRWEPYLHEAEIYLGQGNLAIVGYRDPGVYVDQVLELAEQARAHGADPEPVDNDLCRAHWQRSIYQGTHGIDPRPALTQAAAACERALARKPDAGNYDSLGTVFTAMAFYEADHGSDPAHSVERGARSYRMAMGIDDYETLHYNLGQLWSKLAHYRWSHAMNPLEAVDSAVAEFSVSIRMAAGRPDAWAATGNALIARARFQQDQREDFGATVAQARDSLERALAIDPEFIAAVRYRVLLAEIDGEARLARGDDPSTAVEHMRADTETMLRRLPRDSGALRLRCSADLIAARWALARRQTADRLVARAAIAASQARGANAMDALVWTVSAEVEALRAEIAQARGLPSSTPVADGLAFVAHALTIDPKLVRTLSVRARLERAASAAAGAH